MRILVEFRCFEVLKITIFEEGKMALVMYVKPNCPYCQKARDYYNENGIDFIEYDAQNDKQRQKEMLEYSGGDLVVPCIVENGEYIASGWGNPPRG
jgi:glutaredoxin 3